jgi:hypothetical protein
MELGSIQTVLVKKANGQKIFLVGRVVESESPGTSAGSIVLGCSKEASQGLPHRIELSAAGVTAQADGARVPPVCFVRVPAKHVKGFSGTTPEDLPTVEAALATWLTKRQGIASSDTELQTANEEDTVATLKEEIASLKAALAKSAPRLEENLPRVRARASDAPPRELLANIDDLWKDAHGGDEDDDELEEEELGDRLVIDEPPRKPKGIQLPWTAPGGSGSAKPALKPKKAKSADLDFEAMAARALASGGGMDDVIKMVVLSKLLGDKSKKKRRSATSSSSETDDSEDHLERETDSKRLGLRAVRDLQALRRRVEKHSSRNVEEFERSVRSEMGIVEGQAWTLKDWVDKQQWGKFRSLQRTCYMDVELYHCLRQGKHKQALSQLVQNIKSKAQAALDSGDWTTAWRLTTLEDPLQKKAWAGTETEIAVISGYEKALQDIKEKNDKARLALKSEKDKEDG